MNAPPQQPDPSSAPPSPTPKSLVISVLASEGVLVLLALGGGRWTGQEWAPMFEATPAEVGIGVGAGLGFVLLHALLLFPGGHRNPLYRSIYVPLRTTLQPAVRAAWVSDLVLISVASGVGEELFFRGWLQGEIGIVGASLLFGAAHVWNRAAIPYGVYAAGMGFALGGLFTYTESGLWTPIIAHTVNNLIGLLALSFDWLPQSPSRTERIED